MSKQLPMAINPSVNSKQHVLENLLNCFTFVDTEKKLVIAYPVFLHLGYTKESAHAILSKPMVLQYTNHKGFVPREDFYISIPQIGELIVNAPKTKYVSYILEFVKNILTPLFNQQPQIKHDDFKKEIDMNLITSNQPLTMSSQEMADLTETRHDNVKRTIETLVAKGVIVQPQIEDEQFTDKMGRKRTQKVYKVGKRDSYVVVAQLSPEFTAKLVDRWQELESQVATPALPTSYKDALLMLAQKVGETEELAAENERLNKTKMQISSKREACAMGKLARANDKIKQLTAMANVKDMSETIQNKAVKFATILAIQSRVDNLKANGLKLANFCRRKGLEIKSVDDVRFGRVNSYPAEAWREVYNININSILGA